MVNNRVLLIHPPSHESISQEFISVQIPINLGYLAAVLEKEGAEVKVIDFCVEKFNVKYLKNFLKKFN